VTKNFRFSSKGKTFRTGLDRRGSARERGYDREWELLSLQIRRDEPLCRRCVALGIIAPSSLSKVVDHILPLAWGGARLEPDNLQPLCKDCHDSWKARLEHRFAGRPKALIREVQRLAPPPEIESRAMPE